MARPEITPTVALCLKNAELAAEADVQKPLINALPTTRGVENREKVPWRPSTDLLTEPLEETKWLIEGVLPAGAVVLLSGREGTMKSWLAMDWANAVANGSDWLGRKCLASDVLYLDAEMPRAVFYGRLRAVGLSPKLYFWHWQTKGFPDGLNDGRLRRAGHPMRLIIVDSLIRFMKGLKEKESTDMAEITESLRHLMKYGATILVLHHAPKDPSRLGYRGSTELGAGVDIALTLARTEREGKVSLELTAPKTRYPEDPRLVLEVSRASGRPVFTDATTSTRMAKTEKVKSDLDRLAGVIQKQSVSGAKPSQTEVVQLAMKQELGSRKTILGWLSQGEGARWRSTQKGRTRVYELLSTHSEP